MFLDEALKIHRETGRKIRPGPCGIHDIEYKHPGKWNFLLGEALLKDQWEVEPLKVEVTREMLEKAIDTWFYGITVNGRMKDSMAFHHLCKELGL